MHRSIAASLMRGGTSKGVFVAEQDLPPAGAVRDAFILELLGSPDPMQIDGLGGTHSSTSKLMAVAPSTEPGLDVEYLFAQIAVDRPVVDYGGNCGNLTAAVGQYALAERLVSAVGPITTVRMLNRNTGVVVHARVPVEKGQPREDGDHRIAGVPNPGAEIVTEYRDPGGSVFGRVLPTGNAVDTVETPHERVVCSVVDVTNPLVFVRASDMGLEGDAVPDEVNADKDLLARLEAVRGACAVRLGLVDRAEMAVQVTPGIPKLALVAPPRAYRTSTGDEVSAEQIDILARVMSVQKMHHAFALTGVMCTAAASLLPDTIPGQVATTGFPEGTVRIGHPKGVTPASVTLDGGTDDVAVTSTCVTRTARRLMRGEAFVPGRYAETTS